MTDNTPDTYCFVCKRASYVGIHISVKNNTPCPYCGASLADEGVPWKTLRGYKEGRTLPEVPEVGKTYELSR